MISLTSELPYGLDSNIVRSSLKSSFGPITAGFVKSMNDGADSVPSWRICTRLTNMETVSIERQYIFGSEGKQSFKVLI